MSKNYLKKVSDYFRFKYNPENEMSVELLKKSKQLVLNNNNYNNYSKFYHSFTTRFTYKLPNVSIYPMQKNSEIISLGEIKKNKEEKTEENKRTKIFQPILEYKKYSTISYKEKNENNKENSNSKLNSSNQETINEKIFLNYIDKFNNMNNVMHNYITYRITYYVNQLDEIKYLMSIIQKQKEDLYINIFDDKEINCKLNIFNIYNDIQIKLIFNSIIIYIYDSNNKKVEKIKFPFCFVPFFYGISLQQFKLLLIQIIDFNKEKNILFINKEKLNNKFKEFLKEKSFYNNLSFISNYKKVSEFNFNWLVNFDDTYIKFKLLIKLPHFKTRIKFSNGNKLTFFKTIEIKHVSYLIKENYKDWDLFLLNTFCIYKDFRCLINNALSYNNEYKNNNYINFDENKSKLNFNNNMKNSLEFYIVEKEKNDIFKNLYFKISSPYVEISYIKPNILENLISSKKIQLTFKEAIQLNKLRNSWYPEEIIKKCCILKNNNYNNSFTKINFKDKINNNNNNEIDLNLNKYIFGFDETILKFIKRSKIPIPDKKVTRKNFNIKLIPPEIHWSEKITEKLFKYSMERKDYEKLFDLPLNEWETFILKLLPKIKEHSSNLLNDDDVREKSKKRGTFNFTNNLKSNVNLKRFQKQFSEKKLIVQQQ